MSKHRLSLVGSKARRERIDAGAPSRFLDGGVSLEATLRVDEETLRGLHAQARALFQGGRYERAVDVWLGLSAIDDLDVEEVLMLARAYREIGDHHAAARCAQVAQDVLEDLSAGLWARELTS